MTFERERERARLPNLHSQNYSNMKPKKQQQPKTKNRKPID